MNFLTFIDKLGFVLVNEIQTPPLPSKRADFFGPKYCTILSHQFLSTSSYLPETNEKYIFRS